MILGLDPSSEQVQELRQVCPHAFIVGRVYSTDQEMAQRIHINPKEAAPGAHNAIMERFAPVSNAWQVENEVLQQREAIPLLHEFGLERMRMSPRSSCGGP